ncbi:ABC transporter permease [candidate division KSB1 bacterium]|nr:ABC transporter permease [candidate division KSB1 bacterium]
MKRLFRRHEFYIALVTICLSLVIGSLNPAFFSLSNLFDLLKSSVVMGIFALGVLVVLISGDIDISFTAIAACSMYLANKILLANHLTESLALAFCVSGAIGLVLGLFNAFFISTYKLPALIVTLGTASIFRGFMLAFIGTAVINTLPGSLIEFSKQMLFRRTLPSGEIIGLSLSFTILLILAALTWAFLRYTLPGRGIYAIGGDAAAAERAGFNVRRIRFFIYGFVGVLAGIGGILHSSMMRNANPFDLVGTELTVIAAVVLGGASLTGGRGSVAGTLLAILLIVVINNSLILLNIPVYWQRVAVGAIILISTAVSARRGELSHAFRV